MSGRNSVLHPHLKCLVIEYSLEMNNLNDNWVRFFFLSCQDRSEAYLKIFNYKKNTQRKIYNLNYFKCIVQ